MPVIGYITGGVNFSDHYFVLKGTVPEGMALENARKIDGANLLTYGGFITSFISFVILAFVLFIVIKKFMAALKRESPAAAAGPAEDILLLTEIRDLLKTQKSE